MDILTVNAGSSSVRLALFTDTRAQPLQLVHAWHGGDGAADPERLRTFLAAGSRRTVSTVVHRVVHGGSALVQPCAITAAVRTEIERWAVLAPLHNPAALRWVQASVEALGSEALQLAVFDTALFANLPAAAREYALPRPLCARRDLRRYGFHGLAHQAMWEAFCAQRPDLIQGGRLITLQLGSGCSATAWRDGKPEDTSMGCSPLEGLMMATRSGDVDPGLLVYLQRAEELSVEQLETLLTRNSGLLGVSGESADMRVLIQSERSDSRLAVDMFCYRVIKAVGAYVAVLGGLDGLVFGGGIGENIPGIRARILQRLTWLGLQVNGDANASATHTPTRISRGTAPDVWVIPVDEARVMANKVHEYVSKSGASIKEGLP